MGGELDVVATVSHSHGGVWLLGGALLADWAWTMSRPYGGALELSLGRWEGVQILGARLPTATRRARVAPAAALAAHEARCQGGRRAAAVGR